MLVIPFPSSVVILLCVVTVYISIGLLSPQFPIPSQKLGHRGHQSALVPRVPVRGARLVAGAASSFRLSHPALTPLPVRALPLHGTQRLVHTAAATASRGGAAGSGSARARF